MKKTLTLIASLAAVAILTAACGAAPATPASPAAPTIERVSKTNDTALTATCLSTGSQLSDAADGYIATLQGNPLLVVTSAEVRAAAIDTGTELSSSLRTWANTCRSVKGASEAADNATGLADSIDDLLSTLNGL